MHSYPTRFAHLNRSFFPSSANASADPDYVPSTPVCESAGRRPVTRSMTRATQRAALYATIESILKYTAPVATPTVARVEAPRRRPVTRSMTARSSAPVSSNRHPMTLRSSRR